MGHFSIGFSNLTFVELNELVDTYTRLKSGSRTPADNFGTSQQTSDVPVTTPENNFQTPVEVDEFGVPWNSDFHSSTKKKTLEGRWTLRKGADKAAAAAWAQQHTGLSGQGQVPTPPTAAGAASAPVWGMLPPAPRVIDYHKEFIPLVTELSNNGILTNEKGLEIIQKTGVADSHEFSLNTEKAIAARTAAYDLLLEMKNQAA